MRFLFNEFNDDFLSFRVISLTQTQESFLLFVFNHPTCFVGIVEFMTVLYIV